MTKKTKNTHTLGIDLGTSGSQTARLDENGMPECIPDLDGNIVTRSAVYVSEDLSETSIGESALNMRWVKPQSVVISPKKDIGTDKVYFKRGETLFTPVRCSGEILRHIRRSAIQRSGDDNAGSQVVITVPAYYGEKERQSVKEAAKIADMNVLKLISEPTAAAIAYNLHAKKGDRNIMVYDLGGGTFDVSIIHIEGWKMDVLATYGDRHLGGDNVTDLIVERILQEFEDQHSMIINKTVSPADFYQIWDEAERGKRMLSSRKASTICVRIDGKVVSFDLNREWLKEATKPLIERINLCVHKAIEIAGIDCDQINHILPVGGSSRLIVFREYIATEFGKELIIGGDISPDLAVAEGAAIQAAKIIQDGGREVIDGSGKSIPIPPLDPNDTTPHSLGLAVQDETNSASHCSVVLGRGTPIPATQVKTFKSLTPDQEQFAIKVLQAEEGELEEKSKLVGETILNLPPRDPAVPSIQVTVGYDSDGMVHVEVFDLISNQTKDITIDHFKKGA